MCLICHTSSNEWLFELEKWHWNYEGEISLAYRRQSRPYHPQVEPPSRWMITKHVYLSSLCCHLTLTNPAVSEGSIGMFKAEICTQDSISTSQLLFWMCCACSFSNISTEALDPSGRLHVSESKDANNSETLFPERKSSSPPHSKGLLLLLFFCFI